MKKHNLFRIDWIEAFYLLTKPINSFCYNPRINLNYGEEFLKS